MAKGPIGIGMDSDSHRLGCRRTGRSEVSRNRAFGFSALRERWLTVSSSPLNLPSPRGAGSGRF